MRNEISRATRIPGFLGLLCLLFFLPFAHAEATLDQVFAKMDEASKNFHAIECSLEQTKVFQLALGDNEVQSGKLYFARSGKEPRLKLQIGSPPTQILLIDKGKAQRYIPKIKEVTEFSLGGHSNQVDQFMAIGFGQSSADLKKNYTVTAGGE